MVVAFALQAVCLLLVVTVGRLSGALFVVTLVLVYFTWGESLLALPVDLGRLLRHAPRHVELRVALHRQRASSSIIGGYVAALLYERFGTWTACFYGSAALALMAAVSAAVLRKIAAAGQASGRASSPLAAAID